MLMHKGENMKIIKVLTACAVLITPLVAQAMDDPEMSSIDMSPDNRVQPPEGINTATLREATATVTAIDMENRLVTLEGPDGDSLIVQASDKVKNLPQVEVGDKVVLKYFDSITANIVKLGKDQKLGTEVVGAEVSAPLGAKPGGAAAVEMTRRVEVVFVDPIQKFVSVRSPDRGLRKISLKESPDLQHYLTELKEGDVVEVTYTEAIAIEVVPAD
jgi:hypothetical protein